jgi:ParB family chromosome partitioning protein
MMAKKRLGRGLGALLSLNEEENRLSATEDSSEFESGTGSGVDLIDIRKIEPNENQPRQFFDDSALAELAESIKAYGIIQPLILKDCGGYYSIIAGERRYRAARLANIESVPAIIKDYTDLEILQVALIENIQRQDLTPIEEAVCYRRLIDDFFFSQEDIAVKIGKNRSAISSIVRLLELDKRVQDLISAGRLTISHARVLLALKDGDIQFETAEHAAEDDLSVRETENLVALIQTKAEEANKEEAKEKKPDMKAIYRHAEDELKTLFGAKVNILQGKKKGKIEIEYYSPEELDRLLGLFKVRVGESG